MDPISPRGQKPAAARPKGRAPGSRKPPIQARIHSDSSTFSIERWCVESDLSRTWLYAEWGQGRGPKRVRLRGKVTS